MIAKMPPAQLALVGLCGALTLVLAYEIAAPIPPFDVPRSAETYRPAAITFEDTANTPSPANFGDIDAHPIFSATRTPIASIASHLDTQGGTSSAFPTDVSLIGVIIEGQTRMALIKTASEPFARSVPQGGKIEGWTVSEVDPDKIVLSSGVGKQEIPLAANRASETQGLSVNPGVVGVPNIAPTPNSAVGAGTTVSPSAVAPPPPNLPPAIGSKPPPDNPPPAPHQ